MKFNININQKVLAESKLDLIDCAILDWLIVICNTKNQAVQKMRRKGMTWVDYKTLLKDMPLIRIKSPGALTPRLKNIESEGFIRCSVVGSKGHQKMYVSLEKKVDSLFMEVNANKSLAFTKVNASVHNDEYKSASSVHEDERIIILNIHNDTNNKDSSISNNLDKVELSGFEQFWFAYPKKELKKKSSEIWVSKKLDTKLLEILAFISAAKKTDRWVKGYVKQPTAFLNGECWEDDLSAYGGTIQSTFKPWVGTSSNDYNKKSITIGSNN